MSLRLGQFRSLQRSRIHRFTTFSHSEGMVDVSKKPFSHRIAVASCVIMAPERIVSAIFDASQALNDKGDIIGCAKIAGVFAAKRTAELIPMCHQVPLSQVLVDVSRLTENSLLVTASAKTVHQTGVEMEALTAVSVASLTVYDMTKSALKGSLDKITITDIQLDSKTGGSSSPS